ncbi:type II toxin-antitoxin system HicB family antitoxin [Geminocystis herdmanii]|uniref:type II toxin-antitoxin system HicB family antitoxin n=1 Tax=Geminocystis herdmanii TaxID=669359 RepID=UPI00192C000C|nr:type II toxin-antitoxin system HicB family antitoxin [Geminocystis herdmanii]
MMKKREFYVVIEKDEDGFYVGEVPQLKACYSQGETIDELMENMKEVITMCLEELEENNNLVSLNEFIGVQKIRV